MKVPSLKTPVAILILVFWTNTFTPWTMWVAAVNDNLPDAQTSVPSGWRKIDADGKFGFYLPPDMRDTGVRSLENLHREYTNGRMQVRFDYDPYQHLAYSNRARTLGGGGRKWNCKSTKKSLFCSYTRTQIGKTGARITPICM